VFEIGQSLRQARERQELELSHIEAATRIGSRYLQALEQERFDRLPRAAYARAFLRGYADFLGLDAKLFVDEFGAGFAEPEPLPPPSPRRRRPAPSVAAVALAAVEVAALIGILAFAFSGGTQPQATQPALPPRPTRPPPAQPSAAAPTNTRRPPPPVAAALALTASAGDCWLSVHVNSATGPLLYQGILTTGHSLRFVRGRLWIRIGAPWNLTARLDGVPVTSLPAQTGNVLITRTGIQPLP
jgi:cytoskeleton protein RodZ